MPESTAVANRYVQVGLLTAVAIVVVYLMMARDAGVLGSGLRLVTPQIVIVCLAPIVIAIEGTALDKRKQRRSVGSGGAEVSADLVEVSERLVTAAAIGTIDRTVVRESIELVPAAWSALIRCDGDSFTLGHTSES